jgi:hypothetical protein
MMVAARLVLALTVSWLVGATVGHAAPAPPAEDLVPALAVLRAMPEADGKVAIAVHANAQGHWQFATLAGDVYTAGTPDELKRAARTMAPDAPDGFAGRTLVLSQASLFAGASVLKDLPVAKSIVVAVGPGFPGGSLPVLRRPAGALAVQVRSHVALDAQDRVTFQEALAYLQRSLDGKSLRVFSLTVGGAASLPRVPKFDASTGTAALDQVDPDHLAAAIKSVARQTVVLTGRIEGAFVVMQPASGPLRRYEWTELAGAARVADVDLIVLEVDLPLQPGGQNWLWQRMSVAGLDAARKRPTVADFINAIAAGRGVLSIGSAAAGENRFGLTARLAQESGGLTGWLTTGWLKDAADAVSGQVSGQVLGALRPTGLTVNYVSADRRRHLNSAVFGWLPGWVVAIYAGAVALGLFAWRVLRVWWHQIWPMERAAEYAGGRGYWLARIVRGFMFFAVFAPLAAVPGLVVTVIRLMRRRAIVGSTERVG